MSTTLRSDACTAPPPDVRKAFDDSDLGVQECPGFGSWRVFAVSSDEHSWLEFRSGARTWSAEDDIVYRSPIGQFPGVDETFPLEWHTDGRGTATTVIFRVIAQQPDDPTRRNVAFYVVRLDSERICVLERAPSIEAAGASADKPRQCS